MKLLLKLITMATLLVLAMTASHFLIYKPLIVPRLPGLHSVPLSWWFGEFAPQLAVFLIFGIIMKSWREHMTFSFVAALTQNIFYYLLWTWNEPGHLKAFESPVFDWTLGLLAIAVFAAVCFGVPFITSAVIKRNWKPA